MLVTETRPRNLKWFHAGPLLFGDWGTSRLYVLGLAFYYTGHASVTYLLAMSVIMAGVAWGYTIVCRCFPDGGGVYAASRRVNPTLSVFAATLLLCDYIVTAALSAVEGFHYFGVPHQFVVLCCLLTLVGIGIVNWLGAQSAGRFALIIAVVAILASAIIGVLCLPMLPRGLASIDPTVPGVDTPWTRWESLVRIILALSGVEAVANMTGLMRRPIARTARRTIWPVLIEVVVLNLVFGIALNALPQLNAPRTPDYVALELRQGLESDAVPKEVKQYRDTAVKLLATEAASNVMGPSVGFGFGVVTSIVFGLLLLSAVNTAIMAMVSVMYSLAQDREVPGLLTRLNYSGVPWPPLLISLLLPAGILLIEADVKSLGELYAIGVVGAIAINFLSCAWNNELTLGPWERRGLWALGGLMLLFELTIIVAKPHATLFAAIITGAVLLTRYGVRLKHPHRAEPVPEPASGWLAECQARPITLEGGRPRVMLAARGRYQSEFAVDHARRRKAVLFAIYVRTLRVMDVEPGRVPRLEFDRDAQVALGTTATLAREAGVPFVPIYVTSTDIAEEILDYTVTYGCQTLIMGKTRRTFLARKVSGDVVQRVAALLPDGVSLITRSSDAPFTPLPAPDEAEREDEPPPT
ncbi:MAG: amino acid permease [Phycisphaerales bacterium]|nr:amino acid permease [Phycisphaerales bacterium]